MDKKTYEHIALTIHPGYMHGYQSLKKNSDSKGHIIGILYRECDFQNFQPEIPVWPSRW